MKSIQCTIGIGLASFAVAASAAEPVQCARNDAACFEHNHAMACGTPVFNLETCLNWVAVLEKQAASGNETAAFVRGQAYILLAGMTAADSPEQARSYRQLAKKAFKELVENNPRDAQSMIALGAVTENRDERIQWLRKGIALAPDEISALQLLSSILMESGDAKELREAADLMKQAYSHQTGRNKGYLASSAYSLYQMAGAEPQAKEFQQRVREDIGVRVLKEISEQKPESIAENLISSCDHYALPVLGAATCMQNISIVVQHVTTADRGSGARRLADSAAQAMLDAAGSEESLETENPVWKRTFARWLESLMQAGYESSAVHLSYARVTTGAVRLRALEQAQKLDPNSGEIAFRLGMEYSQLGRWKEAVEALERAQAHALDFQQRAIEYHLQIAKEKSGEGR